MVNSAGPIIYQTNPLSPTPNRTNLIRWIMRILFALLILFIIYQIFRAVTTLIQPSSKVPSADSSTLSSTVPEIALSSSKSEYQINEQITVPIKITTLGHPVIGIDLVIKYDPKILIATDNASIKAFQKGNVFNEFPISLVDSSEGVIRISGIASTSGKGFNGSGTFGTLVFTGHSTGKTQLTIEFTPKSTTDSNMVDLKSGEDILQRVQNLSLFIK